MPFRRTSPQVASGRGRVRARIVNAGELLAALAGIPGARRAPAKAPFTAAAVVAGIEVAAVSVDEERALRRAWRERHGGGAVPLLVVADEPARRGSLRVLGPLDGTASLRSVPAEPLRDAIARVASLPRLEAVREVAVELERLDEAGIPGLRLRELLTSYTLDVRLRRDAVRWQAMGEAIKSVPAATVDWRDVLRGFGYDIERRPRYGHLLRHEGRPVAVVHPRGDAAGFSRLDEEGRPPEGALLNDCQSAGAPFGLLVAGLRFRLLQVDPGPGAATTRYLEIDAAVLQPDDRPFLALLAPPFLAEGEFERLQAEARQFGTQLRERLDETVRQQVLPTLAGALGRWARLAGLDVSDQAARDELERAALTLVFRALFLLYAESARYLPVDHPAYAARSITALVDEAAGLLDQLDPGSTALWAGFSSLVRAMRNGDRARGIPAYNGSLFAADGFEGAATLERAEIGDADFGRVLVGLGRDPQTGAGVDYSTLEIGHLGHIYEGLLSLRLSVADAPLRYDRRRDAYLRAGDGEPVDVEAGRLLWQTHEGGRKGGGVFYTRAELVRHLVAQAVLPRFDRHLDRVRATAATDPDAAAEELFDFAVLDPACGSAHFLVQVVNELADRVVRFLAATPLPRVAESLDRLQAGATAGAVVDDVALLRRLVLKRCVFGVDLSPMGAEVAKLSLWLASFVPGLSLAYLDRNVQVGNSLVGVARPDAVVGEEASIFGGPLREAIERAAAAARLVAESEDATPGEVERSRLADAEAVAATDGLRRVFDLWTAEPFGAAGARAAIAMYGFDVLSTAGAKGLLEQAELARREHRFFHWLLAFPTVLGRDNPGFDAVVGNPPWEQVMVKSNEFYGLFRPGIRSLPEDQRRTATELLLQQRPDLELRLESEQRRREQERAFLRAAEYQAMPGHPDFYKFFCQRYGMLLRHGGGLGVVLPRSAFAVQGSAGFRAWLFEENTPERIDFLLNKARWAFDAEPRYTIALVIARRQVPAAGHAPRVAGTADSLAAWQAQVASPGLGYKPEAFGPAWTVPLLRHQAEADLLAKLRRGTPFPLGPSRRWRCFPVQELNETFDRALWQGAKSGWPLWKGESFDAYDPHGARARRCPPGEAVWRKVRKPRPGADSLVAGELAVAQRRDAVEAEVGRARVAFRDVTRATDSRTVRACLVPPETFLLNSAPYLAFADGGDVARAASLAFLNSLPFDWQARRFVETHLNFFVLEGLVVPYMGDDDYAEVARCAARLSCVDERFAAFAESTGVEVGATDDDERNRLRVEIDARVARAWRLSNEDVGVMFDDLTADAVPPSYRDRLLERLRVLR